MKSFEKMPKAHRAETNPSDDVGRPTIPVVDYVDPPRVRIYDGTTAGAYWFRGIGFTSKITDP